MKLEQIAQVCHEANRAYCESIGDNSQKPWNEAEDWQKQSAINGVKYKMDNPNLSPKDMHNNWMKEKIETGWVYGPVKNPETKEHPCIVAYEELPVEQQKKDALFSNIVKALM